MEKKLAITIERTRPSRRTLVLVLPDRLKSLNPVAMNSIQQIYNHREVITDMLDKTVTALEMKNGTRAFPRLEVIFEKRPAVSGSVTKLLKNGANSDEYRLIASVHSPDTFSFEGDISDLSISHLVTVSFSEQAPKGWGPPNGFGSAHVTIGINRLIYLIVDIMLDITMYYARPEIAGFFKADLDGKRRLSIAKAQYARKLGLSPKYYGDLLPGDLGYISFASLVRAGQDFADTECDHYLRIWKDFIGTISASAVDGRPTPIISVDPRVVAATIKATHHRGPQISERRLRTAIARLPPGAYYFVMAERKPSLTAHRRTLLALFGRTRWRSNLWAVVPLPKYKMFIKKYHYLTFLPFNV